MTETDEAQGGGPQAHRVGPAEGYFVICPTGPVSGQMLLDLAAQAARHDSFETAAPLMWDMRTAEPDGLGALSELSQNVQSHLGNQASGRTAFVVGSELGYGLSRAAASWNSLTGNRELRVFFAHEFDDAVAWLRTGHADTP